jgi:SLBB domain
MNGGFREWLSGLGRREMALLVLVGAALVGGAGLWYVRSLPRPVEVSAGPVAASPTSTPASLFVHVAGWVRRPGVYQLHDGDRVIDAIERAGGPRKGAELGGLNLAALLVDAQQVLVPRSAPAGTDPGAVPTGEALARPGPG